jgi:hypothetical protein
MAKSTCLFVPVTTYHCTHIVFYMQIVFAARYCDMYFMSISHVTSYLSYV